MSFKGRMIKQIMCVYIMEYHSTTKRNERFTHATTSANPKWLCSPQLHLCNILEITQRYGNGSMIRLKRGVGRSRWNYQGTMWTILVAVKMFLCWLYQCLYLCCNAVLQFFKMLPLGETGLRIREVSLYHVLQTACESKWSQKKIFNLKKRNE